MTKQRGIFLGRFNPFHRGHLQVVKEILQEEDEVIIAIGSTQESHSVMNPFTAGERVLMIREAILAAAIPLNRVFIITVPDLHYYSVYVSHLVSYCPSFQNAYTNNKLMRRLFHEAGFVVKPVGLYEREQLNGTRIRKLMIEHGKWKPLLPEAVVKVIEAIDGENRLLSLIPKNV